MRNHFKFYARVLLAACLAAAALLVLGCSESERGKGEETPKPVEKVEATKPETLEKIKIGGPKNIAMLVIIADRKGFFSKAGANVDFEPVQTGKIAMDALISGDLDLGVLVDSNIAFIGYQKSADVQVIASISEKYDDAIIARKDKGITKPKDLVGKKVAYLPATTSHIYLARYLAEQQIDMNKLELRTMTPPAMQAAMLNGTVDAASVWQPFRYNVKKALGDKVVEFNSKDAYVAYALIAARAGTIEKHRDNIKKVINAVMLSEDWIKNNKDEGIAILAEELKMDKGVLASVWDEYKLTVRLDQGLLKLIEDEGKWISETQESFKGKPVPSYKAAVNPEILRDLSADRVTVP